MCFISPKLIEMQNLIDGFVKHSIEYQNQQLLMDKYEQLLNKEIQNVFWDRYKGTYQLEGRQFVLEDVYLKIGFSRKVLDISDISLKFLFVHYKIPSRALTRVNEVEQDFKRTGYIAECGFKEKMWTGFSWTLNKESLNTNVKLSLSNGQELLNFLIK